jgi:hypothetical protein
MTDSDEGEDATEGEEAFRRLNLPEGPGGLLTNTDREFLMRDDPRFPSVDWSGHEAQKRWRVRKRIERGLADFQLVNNLNAEELELILDEVVVDEDVPDNVTGEVTAETGRSAPGKRWGPQYGHLIEAMTFLYRACDVVPFLTFEHLVEETIRRETPTVRGEEPLEQGQVAKGVHVDVNFDIDVEWEDVLDVEEIEAKFDRGERLTRQEIGELVVEGRVDPGEIGPDDVRAQSTVTWQEDLRDRYSEEKLKKVDWYEADDPSDVFEQLSEHYDDPYPPKPTKEDDG